MHPKARKELMEDNSKKLNIESESRKKLIFEKMSPRRQKYINKIGYENWDPFQEPKDPIDIRGDKMKRTTHMLVREFLQSKAGDKYGNEYARGVLDICLGIVNDDERCIGMYDFSCWYQELLRKDK